MSKNSFEQLMENKQFLIVFGMFFFVLFPFIIGFVMGHTIHLRNYKHKNLIICK